MIAEINYITRWKTQLESEHKKLHLIALVEIVEMLNNLRAENAKTVYTLIIDSDICHFIAETMSYREANALSLINKIVCHLSEIEDFFKNDFFRFIKGFLRIINFFPVTNHSPSEVKYHQDIFNCINIVVKR